jgi:hypothetical protein
MKQHPLEGVVSVLAFLVLMAAARTTQNRTLVMLYDLAFFVCIIAALAWLGRAVVRWARR